jgi:hypothetical protein
MLKPKDFEPAGELEAGGVYDAWEAQRSTDYPLQVGDLLESPSGELRIYKYVGFEEAKWVLPEPKTPAETTADAAVSVAGIPSTN